MADETLQLKIEVDAKSLTAAYEGALVEGKKVEEQNKKIEKSFDTLQAKRNAEVRELKVQGDFAKKIRADELADLQELIVRRKDATGTREFNEYNASIKETEDRLQSLGVQLKDTAVKQDKLSGGVLEMNKQAGRLRTTLRRLATAGLLAFGVAALAAVVAMGKELFGVSRATRDLRKATSEFAKELGEATVKADQLFNKLKRLTPESRLFAKTVEDFNKEFGEFVKLKPGATIDELEQAQGRLNERLVDSIRLRTLENLLMVSQANLIAKEIEFKARETDVNLARLKLAEGEFEATKKIIDAEIELLSGREDFRDELQLGTEEQRKHNEKFMEWLADMRDANKELPKLTGNVEDLKNELIVVTGLFSDTNEIGGFLEFLSALEKLGTTVEEIQDNPLGLEALIPDDVEEKILKPMRGIREEADLLATNNGFDDFFDAFFNGSDEFLDKFPQITEAFQAASAEAEEGMQRNQAYINTLFFLGDSFRQLSSIVGEETQRGAALLKIAAIFQIAASTAIAIVNVVQAASKAAAQSGGLAAIPILIGTIAAGTAIVLANIANAKAILSAAQLPEFAEGTADAPGGLSWVGERGKELMYVPQHAEIFTNKASRHKDDIEALNSGKWEDYLNKQYIYPAMMEAQSRQKQDDEQVMEKLVKAYFDGQFDDNRLHSDNLDQKRLLKTIAHRLIPKDIPAPRSRYGKTS